MAHLGQSSLVQRESLKGVTQGLEKVVSAAALEPVVGAISKKMGQALGLSLRYLESELKLDHCAGYLRVPGSKLQLRPEIEGLRLSRAGSSAGKIGRELVLFSRAESLRGELSGH